MRDIKLQYLEGVGFDIDVINGYPTYVEYANQTQDQRAAIGAVIIKGTMPGRPTLGVDWSALYAKESTMLDIDNDVKKMVQTVAGGDGAMTNQYVPLYIPESDGKVSVVVMKGDL